MIAEIVPLARLPKSLSYFDYEVPQIFEGQIKIGQLVKISFKGRVVNGVITKLKEQPEINAILKPIIKILDFQPDIDAKHLELLWWMSDYYSTSPALLLKNFMPESLKRIGSLKIISELKPMPPSISRAALPNIQTNLKKFFTSEKNAFLFHYQNQRNKIAFYLKCAEKFLTQGKSILILEPQITDIKIILPYFLYLFPKKVTVLHGELSKTEYWQNWQKIKNEKIKIVLGARSAIFAPLNNLGLVIVDNEEALDFKQFDQYPYYDARYVALKLSQLTNAKIIFASQSPRVETYYETEQKRYQLLKEDVNFKTENRLVDMNQELKKKNFSSFSEILVEAIQKTLERHQKVVLLLNRKGAFTLMLCRDCDYIFKCPNCKTPLVCHEDESGLCHGLWCHYCGYQEEVPLTCPNCHGVSIRFLGAGTQTVEKEIKRLFSKAKTLRIDKDIKKIDISQLAINDIFIGTQFFIKNYLPEVKNIGLIGIISTDTLLFRPDFRSGEKTFAWLSNIINFGQRIKSHVFAQTFFPNNFVIQSAVAQNYKDFFKREIEEREKLGYPPFRRLAKLIYRHQHEKKCTFESFILCEKIKNALGKEAEIICDEQPRKEKQKFVAKIILKFQTQSLKKIIKFFKTIPDDWTVDMDPVSLI